MKREDEIARVTLAGSVVNLLLVGLKAVAGIAGHSAAMISDAVHSLSDFLSDIVVLVFVRVSGRPQDEDHDYGHGKYETLATLFIGLALAAAAVGIVVSGAGKLARWLQGENLPAPGRLALWAALVSIVAKELLFQYTRVKGRHLQSKALEANAWHHRSDALSSVAVAGGVGASVFFGSQWAVLDPVAALFVAVLLGRVAWNLLTEQLGVLTDRSLAPALCEEILAMARGVEGVSDPHKLRTRMAGRYPVIDLHIRLSAAMPLEQAHRIASDLEHRYLERFGPETIVTLHLEPDHRR